MFLTLKYITDKSGIERASPRSAVVKMNFLSSVRLFGQAVSIILLLSTFASAADDRSASRGTPSKGGTWAEYYAANIKDTLASNINSKPVSSLKPTPVGDVSPQNSVQSRPASTSVSLPIGSYVLQLKTFNIALLSTNFPYKMKYRRSKDITKFVSTFLEEQWTTINSNDDKDNAPTFQLNCNKSRSKMGNDKRWVITCEDNMVIFKNSPKLVDSFISDVLTDKDTMEKFLERMYPRYYKSKQQMMNSKGRSEETQQMNQNNAYIRTYSLEEEEKKMIVVVEEDSLPLSSISQEDQDGNDEGDKANNEESYPTQEGRRQRRRNDMEEQEKEDERAAAVVDEEDGDGGSTRMLRGS